MKDIKPPYEMDAGLPFETEPDPDVELDQDINDIVENIRKYPLDSGGSCAMIRYVVEKATAEAKQDVERLEAQVEKLEKNRRELRKRPNPTPKPKRKGK